VETTSKQTDYRLTSESSQPLKKKERVKMFADTLFASLFDSFITSSICEVTNLLPSKQNAIYRETMCRRIYISLFFRRLV
jgi:hypothetical protein